MKKIKPNSSYKYSSNSSNMKTQKEFKKHVTKLPNIYVPQNPFFEMVKCIVGPTYLDQVGKTILSKENKGRQFGFFLSSKCATECTMNRLISNNYVEYIHQIHIRIFLTDYNLSYVTDVRPNNLIVKVNGRTCQLTKLPLEKIPGVKQIVMPINCTRFLKLAPLQQNIIQVEWSPDKNTYILVVDYVKQLSSKMLLQKLLKKKRKSLQEMKNYIQQKGNINSNLTATCKLFSLICPLSKTKMDFPAKSINCIHLQCFDAYSFISMNKGKPIWKCPICYKSCTYNELQIDSYFLEIASSPYFYPGCEAVEIFSNGTWKPYTELTNNINIKNTTENKKTSLDIIVLDDSDDDICSITTENKST